MEYSTHKINKLRKLLNETEDNDEKNLLVSYFQRKFSNLDFTEYYTSEKYNKDPIINIIEKEKIDILKKVIKNYKIKWNDYIFFRKTPLHIAIENGDKNIIKILLQNNYPLWLPNKNNHTPLEYACLLKDPGMISTLINFGANIKKILYLRENSKNIKFFHCNIDFLILVKKILVEENNIKNIRKEITNNNKFDIIGFENFTWQEFKYGLELFIKRDFPNLYFLYEEIKDSKNMNDFLILFFLFELDFNFTVEEIQYFFLELDYNKNIYLKNELENKFYNDYHNLYSKEFLNIIWHKYKNKNYL